MLKKITLSAALLISLIIYAFYRTENTVVTLVLKKLFSEELYFYFRILFSQTSLPNIVVYSLPEGLWVFCATLISRNTYLNYLSQKLNVSFLPFFFSIILEILQLFSITDGTFDFVDIVFAAFFSVLAFLIPSNELGEYVVINKKITLRTFYLICIYGIVYLSDIVP